VNKRALRSGSVVGLVLLAGTSVPARADTPVAPLIESTYPAAREIRRPDRTIVDVPGGAAQVSAYSPDGRMLATAGRDGQVAQVRLWSARTGEDGAGELLRTLEAPASAPITALGFRATDNPAAPVLVAIAGKTADRWDTASGKLLGSATFKAPLANVAFSPGKDPLVAASAGGRIGLWNFETGAEAKVFDGDGAKVRCVAFAPDGKGLIAGSDKGAVRFWNLDQSAPVRTLETGAGLRSCAISATQLIVGNADGGVKLWALDIDDVHREAPRRHKGSVEAVAFSAKGGEWASAGPDGVIEIRDVATGKQLSILQGHKGPVTTVALNPNGQKVASTGADKTLRFWTMPLPPLPAGDLEKITAALPAKATAAPKKPRKLLVFWRADAILHKGGVPAANTAIELLGKKTGAFTTDFSRDTDVFSPEILGRYDAIVFNSTAHLVMDSEAKKKALLDYVRGGGGVIGIHAAIDMFKGWPEGAKIIGATFAGHPWHPSGTWSVKLEEPDHVLMRAWGKRSFKMHDEFYELGEPYSRQDRRVLMTLDSSDPAITAATPLHRADKDFAVSWIKRYGQGKVFYCMFGHLGDPFQIPGVLQFYLDGIQYALGDLDADATPKPRATASADRPATKL
jgi:type 1 glutamine amidotransferase